MALSEPEELEMLRLKKRKAMAASAKPAKVDDTVPGTPPQPKAQPEPSLSEKAEGALETGLGTVAGIGAAAIGSAAGVVKGLTGGKLGTPEGVREADQFASDVSGAIARPFQPHTPTAQDMSGQFGQFLESTKLAGLNPSEGMAVAAPAVRSAPQIAQGAKVVGKAAETGVDLAKTAGKAVATAVKPDISPATIALAKKAEDFGIPLRPDMLANNKIYRMVGEALEKVPLSGGTAEARTNAFNRAIMKTIGAEGSDKLTPDVFSKAINSSGKVIGDTSEAHPVPLAHIDAQLNEIAANAEKFETADVAKVVNNYVKEIREKAADGAIDGTAFRKLRTKITTQMRNTTNGDLKHALGDLDDTMLDGIQKQLSPEELATFNDARLKYANAKTLEPMVAKSPTGDMSPAALMGRVTSSASGKSAMAKGTSGDLGDLARIGQRFVKEPDSSGTAERQLSYGLLGLGGGAYIDPTVAGGILTGANIYNRSAPALTRQFTKFLEQTKQ